jgi:hypothetical protein
MAAKAISDALLAMHEADRERGIDPLAMEPAEVVTMPAPAAPPFVIEPADWHQEQLDRRRREIAANTVDHEPVEAPARPTRPAAKNRPWRRNAA